VAAAVPMAARTPAAAGGTRGGAVGATMVGGQRVTVYGGLTLTGVQDGQGLLDELERLR